MVLRYNQAWNIKNYRYVGDVSGDSIKIYFYNGRPGLAISASSRASCVSVLRSEPEHRALLLRSHLCRAPWSACGFQVDRGKEEDERVEAVGYTRNGGPQWRGEATWWLGLLATSRGRASCGLRARLGGGLQCYCFGRRRDVVEEMTETSM